MELPKLKSGKYVIIGDLMIDEFNYGTVNRLSPEAPIPILNNVKKILLPGGAANVAMNLAGLGNHVELVGILGDDESGNWLKKYLSDNGIGINGIISVTSLSTIRKVRFGALNKQLLRVDYENIEYDYRLYIGKIIKYIENYLSNNKISGFLISDYNKGMISSKIKGNPFKKLFTKIIENNILCGADTKKYDSTLKLFSGFNFLKPNKAELSKALNKELNSLNMVKKASKGYLKLSGAKAVFVTLGADGIYYDDYNNQLLEETIKTEIVDVTGAGDTAFAVIMNALESGFNIKDSMKLANIAASIVIGKEGTKAISISELIRRVNYLEGR